jgi:predicted DNA-binding transcriptional regulator YafY
MNRIDRLTGILIALQAQPRTAQELADRFEVSRRTILRDVDALSQIQVPIVAIPGPHGGYRLPPDYALPPVGLSSEEATVMLLALSSLGLFGKSPLGEAYRTTREKLLAVLNPDVASQAMANLEHFHVVSDTEEIDHSLVDALRNAAAENRWIEIEYTRQDTSTSRVVFPEQVYLADGRWYLRAIDRLRRARRHFRISRVSGIHPTDTPADAVEIIHLATVEHVTYRDPANPQVEVRLTRRGVEFARDHPDFRNHLHEDRLTFRCPVAELPFYARELIRYGTEVEILGPPELRELVVDSLQRTLNHHQNQ